MKLRNKKTGIIVDVLTDTIDLKVLKDLDKVTGHYTSLAELNEEWEDYEEPKDIQDIYVPPLTPTECIIECRTEEEAEKAVECLRAWKRLKDNGFKFQFWTSSYSGNNISFFIDWINADSKKEIEADLDLLFGGGE